jgi:hypothetical protein
MRQCLRTRAMKWLTGMSFLLGLVLFSSAPAFAQDAGIRGGISVNPDQIYFGGHIETSPLIDHLYFRPNVEVGFGDNVTLIGVNMEFVYKFTNRRPWHVYAGGGPALNIAMHDGEDGSNTNAGLNLLVGVEQPKGLFFEFKIGVVDSPDFKFGVGWTFR